MANTLNTSPLRYDSTTASGNGLGRSIYVQRVVLVAGTDAAYAAFAGRGTEGHALLAIKAAANTSTSIEVNTMWKDFDLVAITGTGALVFVHFNN